MICPKCNGAGYGQPRDDFPFVMCTACDGTGLRGFESDMRAATTQVMNNHPEVDGLMVFNTLQTMSLEMRERRFNDNSKSQSQKS